MTVPNRDQCGAFQRKGPSNHATSGGWANHPTLDSSRLSIEYWIDAERTTKIMFFAILWVHTSCKLHTFGLATMATCVKMNASNFQLQCFDWNCRFKVWTMAWSSTIGCYIYFLIDRRWYRRWELTQKDRKQDALSMDPQPMRPWVMSSLQAQG